MVLGAYHSTARSGKAKVVGGVLLTTVWGVYYCVPQIVSTANLRTIYLPTALYFGTLNKAATTKESPRTFPPTAVPPLSLMHPRITHPCPCGLLAYAIHSLTHLPPRTLRHSVLPLVYYLDGAV